MGFLRRHFNRTWRFTREGRVMFVLTLGLGAAAINTGNNLLYLIFSLSLSMIILSGVLSELNIARIGVKVEYLPDVQVDSEAFAAVRLSNNSGFMQKLTLSISLETSSNVSTADGFVVMLGPNTAQDVPVKIKGCQRGRYRAMAIHFHTIFPFSFFRKGIVVPIDMEALVLPKPIPYTGQKAYAGDRGLLELTDKPGRMGDFWGIREFRPGDDHRRIHHRSSAHTGRPMVMEFTDTGSPRLTIGVDVADQQNAEENIGRAAFFVRRLLSQGWVVRIIAGNIKTTWFSGEEGIGAAMRSLALIKTGEPASKTEEANVWIGGA